MDRIQSKMNGEMDILRQLNILPPTTTTTDLTTATNTNTTTTTTTQTIHDVMGLPLTAPTLPAASAFVFSPANGQFSTNVRPPPPAAQQVQQQVAVMAAAAAPPPPQVQQQAQLQQQQEQIQQLQTRALHLQQDVESFVGQQKNLTLQYNQQQQVVLQQQHQQSVQQQQQQQAQQQQQQHVQQEQQQQVDHQILTVIPCFPLPPLPPQHQSHLQPAASGGALQFVLHQGQQMLQLQRVPVAQHTMTAPVAAVNGGGGVPQQPFHHHQVQAMPSLPASYGVTAALLAGGHQQPSFPGTAAAGGGGGGGGGESIVADDGATFESKPDVLNIQQQHQHDPQP